jgi:tetratricopeptide (TPR) repeat protein
MVRKNRTVSLILYFFSFFAHAGNDEELFLRANKLYETQGYEQALSLYIMMSQKGRAVLYNMGNCYFQKKDYAQALAYWMKAENGATAEEKAMIQQNKNYVLQKLGKKINGPFDPIVSILILQVLFCVAWGMLLFLYYRGRLKAMRTIMLLSSLFATTALLLLQQKKQSTQSGFVIQEQAHVFSGPDTGFDTIASVQYADYVTVKEIRQGWYKIRYSDNIGWVEADAIHVI